MVFSCNTYFILRYSCYSKGEKTMRPDRTTIAIKRTTRKNIRKLSGLLGLNALEAVDKIVAERLAQEIEELVKSNK